jgi:WD40 repeat protein
MPKPTHISQPIIKTTAGHASRSLPTTTTILLLLLSLPLFSQPLIDCPDCPCILTQAQQKVSEKDFESAIRLFNAYKACDPSQGMVADEGILEVFELIREQRDEAIAAQKEAEYQKKKVEDAQQAIKTQSKQLQASTLRSLASSYLNQGRYNEALQIGLQAYEIDPSADSEQIIAQSYQETLKEGGFLLLREFEVSSSDVYRVDIAPDKRYFIAASVDNKVGIWTLEGERINEIETTTQVVETVFSPNSKYFIVITQDHRATLYHSDGQEIAPLDLFVFDKNSQLEFSPQSQYILYYQEGVSGRIWDVQGNVLNDAFEKYTYIYATADVPFLSLHPRHISFFYNSNLILSETRHGTYLTDVYGRFFPTYVEQGDTLYYAKNGPPPFPPISAPASPKKEPIQEEQQPEEEPTPAPSPSADTSSVLQKFKDLLENPDEEEPVEKDTTDVLERFKELFNTTNEEEELTEEVVEEEPVVVEPDSIPEFVQPDFYQLSVREMVDLDTLLITLQDDKILLAQENQKLHNVRVLQLYRKDSVSYAVYFLDQLKDYTQRKYRVNLRLINFEEAEAEKAQKKIIYYSYYNKEGNRTLFEKSIEHQQGFSTFSPSPGFEYLITVSAPGKVQVWDLLWPDRMSIFHSHPSDIVRIAPEGDYILVHEPPFYLNIYGLDGQKRNKSPIQQQYPQQIENETCFINNGAQIKTQFGKLVSFYSPSGTLLSTVLDTLHSDPSKEKKPLSPDKNTAILAKAGRMLTVDSLQNILLWDLAGRLIQTVSIPSSFVFSLDADEASSTFLVSTDQEQIFLVDATGKVTQTFRDSGSARFSPQGNYIITQSNQWVRIWTRNGKQLFTFPYDTFMDFAADESFFLLHREYSHQVEVIYTPKGLQQFFDHSSE